jgi:hypothetical protein
VDVVQQALVNLCTKPEAQIPSKAKKVLAELEVFDGRLRAIKETLPIAKELGRGADGITEAFRKLHARGERLVGKSVSEEGLSSAIVSLRNAAAEKVFAGSVAIKVLSTAEAQRASAARERIEYALSPDILEDFSRLALSDVAHRLRKEVQVLGIGLELLEQSPNACPFCEQAITDSIRSHVENRHAELLVSVGNSADASSLRVRVATKLKEIAASLATYSDLQVARSSELIAANSREVSEKIKALFGKGNEEQLFLIAGAGAAITPSHKRLKESASQVLLAIEVCEDAVRTKTENVAQIEALAKAVVDYLKQANVYGSTLEEVAPTLSEPTRVLQQAVDATAGTTELSLLIETLAARDDITRAGLIRATLDGLKILRKRVDQAVGQTMENVFASDLTGAVMRWYEKIRTTSDPDVHFSGFAMERTKAGDFKNRRVRVAAHSYGVELASAVSSLSESKLNALGLCMSIATALRASSPWGFLVLDDPIQSWDDDHEVQFIEILRALAEDEGRQIILLSHRDGWIDQVAAHCRSLNGIRYHITGYTKDGPTIQAREWASIDQRLREALTIAKDPTASGVRLQHAEEEIRIVAAQLIAETARVKLGRIVGAHNVNSERARAILNEAGCSSGMTDRVTATFETTDPAHHAPKDYAPSAERVRQYHGTLSNLKNWIEGSN